jgi:DNA-binding NarL/FixJ family response regulator
MRVVVANQPRILRESIATALAVQGEIEVVVGAANAAAILRSVEQHKPDCLILSLEVREANPRICRAVLSQHPQTLILAVGPKTLTIYWFEVVVRSARKECSLQSILDLLRTKLVERTAKCRPTASAKDCPTARDIPVDILPKREHVCF